MNARWILLPACLLALFESKAQSTSYDDVAVVVNSNSPGSVQIGNYFMAARNIPPNRLITIDAPLTTSITQAQFDPILASIEEQITLNGLMDSINYIVTTLGVPIRIDNGTCDSLDQFSKCSSFDTDIALMLGPYASSITAIGFVANPFFNSAEHQNHAISGIYLVTRLAGPTVEAVLELIDRSGPGLVVEGTNALMVGDINNPDTSPGVQGFWNDMIQNVTDPAADAGIGVQIDTTSQFLDNLDNVVGYVSLTSYTEPWLPTFNWAPGALAVEWYSYSGSNYDTPGAQPGYSRLSEWIGSGATAAVGTVNLTYSAPWSSTGRSFERYLDTTYHFNAAESMYAGISWLSWIYDAIGDPKTSIAWAEPAGVHEDPSRAQLLLRPNPCDGHFTLRMPMDRLKKLRIADGLGREVGAHMEMVNGEYTIDLNGAQSGMYVVKATTASGADVVGRIVVQP